MVQWHLERGFTVSEKLRNSAIWNLEAKLHTLQTSELRLCIEVGCQLRVLAALIPGTDWTKGLTAQYNSERSVEENFPRQESNPVSLARSQSLYALRYPAPSFQ
jgi:hypothetical protein